MTRFLLLPFLLVIGCGDGATSGGADSASSETSGATYTDSDLDPCEMLPPAMAAEALGVTEAQIERNAYSVENVPNACIYDVVDGDDQASFFVESVEADAAAAEDAFAQQYRVLSEDELGNVARAADDAMAAQVEDGEIAQSTADAADAGDTIAGMAAAVGFEPLDGVGDQAVVSTFRGMFDKVYVRDGNLIFGATVSVADSPDAMEENREPSIALARAILAGS